MADLIKRWKTLFESEELPAVREMLADDINMHSPMMHNAQRGVDLVAAYIVSAHEIYSRWNFDYVRCFQNGNEICMEFEGTIDGTLINGVDLIRWNDEDKIDDFKIIVRPAEGLKKLGEVMVKILAEVQESQAK